MNGKANDAPPDFLARMVDKAFGSDAGVAPQTRSVFEPPQEDRIAAIADWTEETIEAFTETSDRDPKEPIRRSASVRTAELNQAPQHEELPPRSTRNDQAVAVETARGRPSTLPARSQDRGPPTLTARHDRVFDLATQPRDLVPAPISRLQDAPSASIVRKDAERPQSVPPQVLPASDERLRLTSDARLHLASDARSHLHTDLPSPDLSEPVPTSASPAPASRQSEASVVPRPSPRLRTPAAPALPPEGNHRHAAAGELSLRLLFAGQSAPSLLVSTPSATSARVLAAAPSAPRRPRSDQRPGQQLEAPPAPIVNVTIGRVEVRAASAPAAPAPRSMRGPQPLSLEDYLKRRGAR